MVLIHFNELYLSSNDDTLIQWQLTVHLKHTVKLLVAALRNADLIDGDKMYLQACDSVRKLDYRQNAKVH